MIIARLFLTLLFAVGAAQAAVLPEDRADLMYHSYDGQNVQVDGPSLLVRKSLSKNVSVTANYYIDNITSASIDVVTQGSAYTEERKEGGLGADFLYEDTTFSVGISNSEENDYSATTYWFGLTQEFFGGLSTLSMGYGRGDDEVRKNGDPDFVPQDVDRRSYRLGFTQVLSKNALLGLTWETITDEGYLNNPYRSYRFFDQNSNNGLGFATEIYPNTRTSNAASIRGRYFLAPASSVHAEYRYFNDDWDITAHNIEFKYTRRWGDRWLADVGYRYYTQTGADFFSNIFLFEGEQNFMGRDKETSPFDNHTLRFGVSYEFMPNGWWLLDNGTVNFNYDFIRFSYDEYTDNTNTTDASQVADEKLLEFNAHVFRIFVSVWF